MSDLRERLRSRIEEEGAAAADLVPVGVREISTRLPKLTTAELKALRHVWQALQDRTERPPDGSRFHLFQDGGRWIGEIRLLPGSRLAVVEIAEHVELPEDDEVTFEARRH